MEQHQVFVGVPTVILPLHKPNTNASTEQQDIFSSFSILIYRSKFQLIKLEITN